MQITQFVTEPYTFPSGHDARRRTADDRRAQPGGVPVGVRQRDQRRADAATATAISPTAARRSRCVAPGGLVIQNFTYDDGGGWPTAADGGGKSLELINPLADPDEPRQLARELLPRRFAGNRRLAAGHRGRLRRRRRRRRQRLPAVAARPRNAAASSRQHRKATPTAIATSTPRI